MVMKRGIEKKPRTVITPNRSFYLFIFQLHLCFRMGVRYLPELWSLQRKRKKKPTAVKTFSQRHSAHVTVGCVCCGGLPGEEHEKEMLGSKKGCCNRRGASLFVHAAECRIHARWEADRRAKVASCIRAKHQQVYSGKCCALG